MSGKPAYNRVLLKLSGEALMGTSDYGIDPPGIRRVAQDVLALRQREGKCPCREALIPTLLAVTI